MANNSGQDKDEEQRTNDGAGERRRDSGLFNRGRGRGHRMRSSYDRELYQNEIADTSRRGRRRTVSDSDGLHGSYGRGCGPGTDRRGRRKSDQGPRYRPPYQSAQKESTKRKIILFESPAPPHCQVKLVPIPNYLSWKFVVNPDTLRYWIKLMNEDSYRPPLGMGIKDNDRHHKNVKKLREALKPLLRKHLDEKNEFKFWCEARLGRLAWRASEADLHERIKLSDVSKHYDKEFYTRTTTKADDMFKKLQSCCLMDSTSPLDIVGLQVNDMEQRDNYKVFLDESPPGKFTLNIAEGCIYAKTFACNKTEFVCFGRSHDLRIASDCERYSRIQKPVPPAAIQAIEKIAASVQRTDTGQLKMILKSGCVKVDHVRQKKCSSFTTMTDENFGVRFYELKETNCRSHFPREDEIVTLEHNTNQEIEVETTREIRDQAMITEILDTVEKLVDFGLDVVDMAEECRDPAIPY